MFSNACKFTSSTADHMISCEIYSITGNVLIAEFAVVISLCADCCALSLEMEFKAMSNKAVHAVIDCRMLEPF